MERYFKHFKGGIYKFLYAAKHSETQEEMVVYQAMYGDNQVWVRPATMFFGTTVVDGKEVQRFTEIENPKNIGGMVKVKFKKMHPNAKIPTKAHDSDFCYDCYAVSREEVSPGVWKYGLGIALQFKQGVSCKISKCFTIRPRSSVWKTGMVLSNSIATIDEGYTGEISAVFYHVNKDLPIYEVGDRVAQLHIDSALTINFQEVDELDDTDRGSGSYGSTGK